ncbi:uncharacterized protein LOC130994006 [Salvia miltiorrhiza]|uniref:uncharacterized protein LOC130994006 n=1 Tax=Salvia miltiorrhiza TaxID=226208 RepID=UPI0025ABFE3E|nr:uncharacterized protein LOC130994006 [Salvia miltiorrhiza]
METTIDLKPRHFETSSQVRRSTLRSLIDLKPRSTLRSFLRIAWGADAGDVPQLDSGSLMVGLIRAPCSLHPRIVCNRENQVKLLCDAAVDPSVGMGFGILCKNVEDQTIGSKNGFFPGVFMPIKAEARAMLEGLKFGKEKGLNDVIIETDCQVLYWLLVKNEVDLSYLGSTLESIRSLAASLHHHAFSWTPREENEVADSLAKQALCDCFSVFVFADSPSLLNS